MSHNETITTIRNRLITVFTSLDAWCNQPEELRRYRPENSWSIDLVLEHVTLTNRFLLMTLKKQQKLARKRYDRGQRPESRQSDLARLNEIGRRGSFAWTCPEHMNPSGELDIDDVRATLYQQLGECLITLEHMKDGSGSLVQVTMTVNDLGKIDLYQWLYFLAQHAHRHLDQLASIQARYSSV